MIRGVLFDWRGTLVADPPDEWWITRALSRLGREQADAKSIVDALATAAKVPLVAEQQRQLDCSASRHRTATMLWFHEAGLDPEFAEMLYRLDFEPENHRFFPDVADVLRELHSRGIATAVVSDIHFDLRPEFAAAGRSQLIDAAVLSFEHGVQRPARRSSESLPTAASQLTRKTS